MTTVQIDRRFALTFTPNDTDRFTEVANKLSLEVLGHELDSYDAGDAVGAVLQVSQIQVADDGIWVKTIDEITISVIFTDAPFIWSE